MSFKLKSIKKLIHVQKTCRSFTEIFRSKLHITKARNAIKKVTNFLFSSHQKLRFRSTRQRSTASHHYHLLQEGSPAIFISQLYVQKSGQLPREPETSKDIEPYVGSTGTSTCGINLEKNVATKDDLLLRERKKDDNRNKNKRWLYTHDIRGVDERAANFISKVREDMKLQREQSILEFQEMLARSV